MEEVSSVELFDQALHQVSRLYYWVRPSPERAMLLADYYLFPMIVLTCSRPFGTIRSLNLLLATLFWLYYLGAIAFVVIAKRARNETWRGLGTGEYTLELIDAVSGNGSA